jgi:hypothetical protein
MAKKIKVDINAEDKAKETINEAKKATDELKLRAILTPFAQWIYGPEVPVQGVIDKYFKQVINK